MSKSYTDKRVNRSDKYQYIICEILLSNEAWGQFSEAQEKNLPLSDEKREILLDWDHELKLHLYSMIDICLTKRQKQVLTMYCNGMTQMEIADELNINQSSVTKSLNGNTDYTDGKKKVYGGLKKKFAKLIQANQEIRPIMKKIHLVWEPNSVRLIHYQTFRNLLGNEDQFERWLDGADEFNKNYSKSIGNQTNLTPEQILQIKRASANGISKRQLAKEFHISTFRLKKILEMA